MPEPDLEGLLQRLSAQAMVFSLQGEDVEVLGSPDEFFQELMAGLRSAQHHITIASLYFGTGGGQEAEFGDALAAAAQDASRPHLHVHILLDALRSTRPTRGTSSSGGTVITSTAEMLAIRLLEGQAEAVGGDSSGGGSGSRLAVALFHTPALRGLLKRVLPPRVSEVIGVQHMKAYCFDDAVIISGANISSTYMSTRQDRYLVLRRSPQLAALLRQVVHTVGRFSYQLLPLPAAAATASGGTLPAATGNAAGRRRRDVLLELLQQQQLPWQQPLQLGSADAAGHAHVQPNHPHHLQRHRQQRQQRYRLAACPAGVDPVRQAHQFSSLLSRELLQLFVPRQGWDSVLDIAVLAAQEEAAATEAAAVAAAGGHNAPGQRHTGSSSWRSGADPALPEATATEQGGGEALAAASAAGTDTWIVPMVQAGFAGLRQEERCTLALLAWSAQQQQQHDVTGSRSAGTHDSSRGSWTSSAKGGWNLGGSSCVNNGDCGGRRGGPSVLLQLASPYLNLARPYEWFLSRQATSADLELITASPEANSFFGSKGVSGYIPLAYSLLELRTWRRLTRHLQRSGGVSVRGSSILVGDTVWRTRQLEWWQRWARQPAGGDEGPGSARAAAVGALAREGSTASRRLWEYCSSGWEFHAKGIWVSLPAAPQQPPQPPQQPHDQRASGGSSAAAAAAAAAFAPPAVTAVGSSNFGFRSLHRDLEMQFILVTRNPGLRQALGREVTALKAHCQEVVGDAHFQAPGRRGGAVARIAVRLLRGFL